MKEEKIRKKIKKIFINNKHQQSRKMGKKRKRKWKRKRSAYLINDEKMGVDRWGAGSNRQSQRIFLVAEKGGECIFLEALKRNSRARADWEKLFSHPNLVWQTTSADRVSQIRLTRLGQTYIKQPPRRHIMNYKP